MSLFDFVKKGKKELVEADIQKQLKALGLPIEKFNVLVEGKDTVILFGWAKTLADKEKAIVAAGNVEGVAKVRDRIRVGNPDAAAVAVTTAEAAAALPEPPAAEAPLATFYVVKAGDTLSKIAKQHYGNASKYTEIFEANKPMLKHPDKIYPGQSLRIPKL